MCDTCTPLHYKDIKGTSSMPNQSAITSYTYDSIAALVRTADRSPLSLHHTSTAGHIDSKKTGSQFGQTVPKDVGKKYDAGNVGCCCFHAFSVHLPPNLISTRLLVLVK
ncbi:hypothetical protein Agabi119p4_10746 [Agaricus bisporus var. burnettii]|uniref:Uncharacterized protein n=1 Tax=Agaricus bisporus var. burnettii TaxID=192524 RepID=A0A8H7C137_AGABI|nr:hypothetical protein Agabi119p4_10746 [Agaricus bisporus var. burnettii]